MTDKINQDTKFVSELAPTRSCKRMIIKKNVVLTKPDLTYQTKILNLLWYKNRRPSLILHTLISSIPKTGKVMIFY